MNQRTAPSKPPAPNDSFSPYRLASYLVLDRLGQGRSGETFLAKAMGPRGFETWVSLKCVSSGPMERDARLSLRLSHPNIVRVLELVEVEATSLLAMEYIESRSLAEIMARLAQRGERLSLAMAAFIANEACKGLDHAHNLKDHLNDAWLHIVHRGITPSSILVSLDGSVRLADFGMPRSGDAGNRYESPELARGGNTDHRTDLFSLSVILAEMLGAASAEDAPAELKRCLALGLAPEPAARYQSALQMRTDLTTVLGKSYPSDPRQAVADLVTSLFSEELERDRARLLQLEAGAVASLYPKSVPQAVPTVTSPVLTPRTARVIIFSIVALAALAIGIRFFFS